jgi:hypothetical protein
MSLTKTYVRNGNRKIIGSVTSGFSDETEIVRDGENHVVGKVNRRFENTRDAHGNLVSVDTADPGLLIGRRK